MAKLVQLVFYGEVLPGYDAVTAQGRLAKFLKLEPTELDPAFAGQRIVLRKGMSQAEAELYVLHMEHMGLRGEIEKNSAVAPPSLDETTVPAPLPARPAPVVPAAAAMEAAPPIAAAIDDASPALIPEPVSAEPAPVAAARPTPEPSVAAVMDDAPPALVLEPVSAVPTPATAARPAPPPPVAATMDNTPPALALEPVATDEMICPKCGERQPPRNLCRACAVDMKRFVAAQQEAEEVARAERLAASRDAVLSGRRAALPGPRGNTPSMIGFGLSGRLGRCAYLGGLFLGSAMLAMGWLLTLKTQTWAPAVLGLFLSFYYTMRVVVLRCHDREWSGWLSLLCFVPVVNLVFMIILIFLRGTTFDNEYGEDPPSAGLLAPIAMLVIYGVLFMVLARPENQAATMRMLAPLGVMTQPDET